MDDNDVWYQYGSVLYPKLKIINIVKALYDGFECAVVEEEATSEWFE